MKLKNWKTGLSWNRNFAKLIKYLKLAIKEQLPNTKKKKNSKLRQIWSKNFYSKKKKEKNLFNNNDNN